MRWRRLAAATVFLAGLQTPDARATEYSFRTIMFAELAPKLLGRADGLVGDHVLPMGLNNRGDIVGLFGDGLTDTLGFVFSTITGTGSVLPFMPVGINNTGTVLGYYPDPAGYPYPSGFVPVDYTPEATPPQQYPVGYLSDSGGFSLSGWVIGWRPGSGGINDLGQVVGNMDGGGFIRTGTAMEYVSEALAGINNSGQMLERRVGAALNNLGDIVGNDRTTNQPFLIHNGVRSDFLAPADYGVVTLSGINDRGQIIGSGYFAGQDFGFVATPIPEPVSLALLATGVIGVAGARRAFRARRRRFSVPNLKFAPRTSDSKWTLALCICSVPTVPKFVGLADELRNRHTRAQTRSAGEEASIGHEKAARH